MSASKKPKGNAGAATSSTAPSGYNPPPAGPVPMTALQSTIEAEITKSWNTKPYGRFPIHKDLPRFIRTITVASSTAERLYTPNIEENQAIAIRRLVRALAETFEPANVERLVTPLSKLLDKVDTESMRQALEAMDDIEQVSSPTMKLFKSLNQGILAPALVNLQLSFMNTRFMFSDVSWNIAMQIFDNHVRVEHRRIEGFVSGAGHFAWSSVLTILRSDMSLLSVKTRIYDYRIPDATVEAEWLQLIKPIYELDTKGMCGAIFAKEWGRLPIAKDLVRFASNTIFLLGSEKVVLQQLGPQPIDHLKILLLKISELGKDEEMSKLIESTYEEGVAKWKAGDLNAVIKSYFVDVLQWTEQTFTARFCKFFTQSILAPLATNLQLGLSGIVPIKDGGVWTVSVSLIPSGFVIRHTKEQMSLNRTDPTKAFDFVWQCEFEVNTDVSTLVEVKARVVSLALALPDQLAQDRATQLTTELTSLINVILM